MVPKTWQTLLKEVPATIIASSSTISIPPVAAHGSLDCPVPETMGPLFGLLHSITSLTFLGGVGLATLGFSIAGVLFMIPGPEYNRKGKLVARGVLIGTILLLSANMIVSFIIDQMNPVFC